jgi:excisionase family DNA binding protein
MKNKKEFTEPLTADRMLTSREVCDLLRITYKTLSRRMKAGLIKGIRVSPKAYLFRESEIKRYLDLAESGAFATAIPQKV